MVLSSITEIQCYNKEVVGLGTDNFLQCEHVLIKIKDEPLLRTFTTNLMVSIVLNLVVKFIRDPIFQGH